MAEGVRDLKDLALPSGWDATYLQQQTLKDGTTYEAVFSMLVGSVGAFNAALAAHNWLPGLSFITEKDAVRYRQQAGEAWETHNEYALPDAQRAAMTGHMLPKKRYDKALGWTWDYLMDAYFEDVEADIQVFLETALDLFERLGLQKFFKSADETVGTSGTSPGLVGGGSLTFTPPPYGGESFDSTHTHWLRYDSTALGQAVGVMTDHLREHGHMPPYELLIADADKAIWSAISDATYRTYFRSVQRTDIEYGTETLAGTGVSEEVYIGVVDTPSGVARVRPMARIPTTYAGMYKSYGANDRRNPVYRTYNPKFGMGVLAISADKIGFPVQSIIGFAEFGYGIGADRTNGTCLYVAGSGSYTDPTIT